MNPFAVNTGGRSDAGLTDVPHVVVITPNPAVDITYHLDDIELGASNRVATVNRQPGGKGLNVARVLRVMEVPVVAVLPLGGPTGRWMSDSIDALGEGISSKPVPIADATRSTTTIVANDASTTVFLEPGPTLRASEWAALSAAVAESLDNCDVLIVAGSFPPPTPEGVLETWVRQAHDRGVTVVIDTSGPMLLAAAGAGADYVTPNVDELRQATGLSDLDDGAMALLRHGAAQVLVTCGAEGIHGYRDGTAWEVAAIPGIKGNPTGAGDAAVAGLVAALRRGDDLVHATRYAAACGAAAVLQPTAGVVNLVDIERFMRHDVSGERAG